MECNCKEVPTMSKTMEHLNNTLENSIELKVMEPVSDDSVSDEDYEVVPLLSAESFEEHKQLDMNNLTTNCECKNYQHELCTVLERLERFELAYKQVLDGNKILHSEFTAMTEEFSNISEILKNLKAMCKQLVVLPSRLMLMERVYQYKFDDDQLLHQKLKTIIHELPVIVCKLNTLCNQLGSTARLLRNPN